MNANIKQIEVFFNKTSEAAKKILESLSEGRCISVRSHLDADGLAAAGIIGAALTRLEANFRIRIDRWFDEKVAEEISSDRDCLTILTDMGSGYLDILNKRLLDIPLIILDHHQAIEEASESFIHINPHLYGIDGSRDLSGAGLAYFVAKNLNERNIDLAYLGVIGALGDVQDKYDQRKLGGINEIIVEDAEKTGYLKVETDLLFFGRETRPIHKALAYTTSPFIPGVSGEEDKSLAFITSLGIKPKEGDKWRALRDLSQDEKNKLFSALAEYLASRGIKSDVAMNLLGTVYTLTREEPWTPLRDTREFALLLNATGRTDKPSLGVAICMGDRGTCLEEANRALEEYRRIITKYLNWLNENPECIEELESIYVIHGDRFIDEKVISAISTILLSNLPKLEKPIIAYSAMPEEKLIKISARAVDTLTRRGLNLGEILRIAAEKFSGKGGGHDVAAGAQVPYSEKTSFIKHVDELVKKHLEGLDIGG